MWEYGGGSDPIIEAGEPSTVVGCSPECARPTEGSHGRTTRGPAQRWAKPGRKARRPRLRGYKGAAKGIIEAGGRLTPSPGGALVWPPLCLS